jgi:hypothetical protein
MQQSETDLLGYRGSGALGFHSRSSLNQDRSESSDLGLKEEAEADGVLSWVVKVSLIRAASRHLAKQLSALLRTGTTSQCFPMA